MRDIFQLVSLSEFSTHFQTVIPNFHQSVKSGEQNN